MKPNIETLVKELCESQPELAKDISLLRTIVAELVDSQPGIVADENFKQSLRQKLYREIEKTVKPKTAMPWWLIYTVPVGVTAVLLLVVYPNLTTTPQPPRAMDSALPADFSRQVSEEAASDMESANMKEGAPLPASTMTSQDFFTASFEADRQSVNVTYALLSQPGFIVVSGLSGVVAISEVINPGEYFDIKILVTGLVSAGKTYTATLYYDNGDGVFTEDFDFVAFGQSGQTNSTIMIAP